MGRLAESIEEAEEAISIYAARRAYARGPKAPRSACRRKANSLGLVKKRN